MIISLNNSSNLILEPWRSDYLFYIVHLYILTLYFSWVLYTVNIIVKKEGKESLKYLISQTGPHSCTRSIVFYCNYFFLSLLLKKMICGVYPKAFILHWCHANYFSQFTDFYLTLVLFYTFVLFVLLCILLENETF